MWFYPFDREILGFPRGKNKVSKQEIEHQFRTMSRKQHTDKGGTNDGFQKLSDAKESLLKVVESVVDDKGNSMSQLDELIASEGRAIELYENNEMFEKDCQEARVSIGELKNHAEQRAHEIQDLKSRKDNIFGEIKEYGANVDEEPGHNVGSSHSHDM